MVFDFNSIKGVPRNRVAIGKIGVWDAVYRDIIRIDFVIMRGRLILGASFFSK